MRKSVVGVGAAIAMVTLGSRVGAEVGATLLWTFNGEPCQVYSLRPGDTVTVGLSAIWFDTDHVATAFGALVGAEVSITGDTGTSESDVVSNLARVNGFTFGAPSLNGALANDLHSFAMTGIGPAQNQFALPWHTESPTPVMWQFDFTAGPELGRTVVLDIGGVDNALLFTQPFESAINVPAELVQTSKAFILVPLPAPGALAFIGVAGLATRRRRR